MHTNWDYAPQTETGPFDVSIDRGVWTDDTRSRSIPYKVYTPVSATERFPTIIWSHGLGGGRDGAAFISRHLASHGYAVVHVQHAGTDTGLWEGKPGHPWDVIRATHIPRSATLARLKDIPFALDRLMEEAGQRSRLDLTRLGMSGHSFGAMTTQVMAGQKRGGRTRLYSLAEKRFRAGLVYSPVPVPEKHGRSAGEYYGGIGIPLFFMTGTDDGSPLDPETDYHYRLEVFAQSGGPDQSLLVLNDGDHMVFSGSRGQLKDNPKRDLHEKIIRCASLAFWDAYLKDDETAKTWLTLGGFSRWLADEGRYEFKQ